MKNSLFSDIYDETLSTDTIHIEKLNKTPQNFSRFSPSQQSFQIFKKLSLPYPTLLPHSSRTAWKVSQTWKINNSMTKDRRMEALPYKTKQRNTKTFLSPSPSNRSHHLTIPRAGKSKAGERWESSVAEREKPEKGE
jgi:hypothetical protein